MSNTLEQIANHLEFLGYAVEIIKNKEEGQIPTVCTAEHSSKSNIVINEFAPNFIRFSVGLTTERRPSPEANSFVNELNGKLIISQFNYDVDEETLNMILRFYATYIGEYSKSKFSQFYDFFNTDQQSMSTVDSFDSCFQNND